MSEYQYYEFVAIDKQLTQQQISELRSRSSRATITVTSFINEYHWGDLNGDPADWMRRYFDVFVYEASWCSCRFMLRVPANVFRKSELQHYITNSVLTVDETDMHWIIDWSLNESEAYDRFSMEGGQGWMGRLAPLRDELLCGDLRPLYLGWLAGVTVGEVDNETVGPEVPPGMGELTTAQQALAEFLEVNPDLITAAAVHSPAVVEWNDDDSVETWVAGLSKNEITPMISLLLHGESQQAARQIKSAFFSWRKETGQDETLSPQRYVVAELQIRAAEAQKIRKEHEEKEQQRQIAEQRAIRETYLKTLAADFDHCWKAIHPQIERGTAGAYDEAKRAIADLSEAYMLVSSKAAFDYAMRSFMSRHTSRGALVRRLVEAGLWKKSPN